MVKNSPHTRMVRLGRCEQSINAVRRLAIDRDILFKWAVSTAADVFPSSGTDKGQIMRREAHYFGLVALVNFLDPVGKGTICEMKCIGYIANSRESRAGEPRKGMKVECINCRNHSLCNVLCE